MNVEKSLLRSHQGNGENVPSLQLKRGKCYIGKIVFPCQGLLRDAEKQFKSALKDEELQIS